MYLNKWKLAGATLIKKLDLTLSVLKQTDTMEKMHIIVTLLKLSQQGTELNIDYESKSLYWTRWMELCENFFFKKFMESIQMLYHAG